MNSTALLDSRPAAATDHYSGLVIEQLDRPSADSVALFTLSIRDAQQETAPQPVGSAA